MLNKECISFNIVGVDPPSDLSFEIKVDPKGVTGLKVGNFYNETYTLVMITNPYSTANVISKASTIKVMYFQE